MPGLWCDRAVVTAVACVTCAAMCAIIDVMTDSYDYDALTPSIVERMRFMRKVRGMSAQVLADAMTADGYKMLRTSLANLEGGARKSVSAGELVAFSRALGVPLDYWFTGEGLCQTCVNKPPAGFRCETCGRLGE